MVRFVDELGAACGGVRVYFVLGNHDYYRGSIRIVRDAAARQPRYGTWLPAAGPVQLTERVVLVGVDGWGDARCGDPVGSKVLLSDWKLIEDFRRGDRNETLQRLGANEARALRETLARTPASEQLVVLTHVPPFPEACWHDGAISDASWLPWFTCVAVGEVLREHAAAHPTTRVTVLCGHTHGAGAYEAAPNLTVHTGGWAPGIEGYGNPIVQTTFAL